MPEWTQRGLIKVWDSIKDGPRAEVRVHDLIACMRCRARVDESCKTATDRRPRGPHRGRLAPRLCPCGELPSGPTAVYCEPCRVENDRLSKRAYMRRWRASQKSEVA